MSLSEIFRLYAVKCGSTVFSQLQDSDLASNVQGLTVTPPGGSLPLFTANMQERPTVSFGTMAIEQALGLFGVKGGSAGSTVMIAQQMVNLTGPTAIGSSVHSTWTSSAVHGYINQLTANNRQPALASVMLRLLRSGATPAITYAGTATISDTLTGDETFVLGPIVLGGSVIEGTNDLNVQLNPSVVDPDDDYQVEPIFACISSTAPVITFTTTDSGIWSLHNTAFSGVNPAKFNLIKMEANAQQYATASTEHILGSCPEGRITCERVSGARQLTRVRLDLISDDGSSSELTMTPNSAVATS